MANKKFDLDDTTVVNIYKRRNSRNLRLSVAADGEIRVSIPSWAPYRVGLEFAKTRRQWINSQKKPARLLTDGQAIGKAHHLRFSSDQSIKTLRAKIRLTEIIVVHPTGTTHTDQAVQAVARKACIRALRQQAHLLLPQRLADLAAKYDFTYNTVVIKQLKSRWGSCDQHGHIVLNLYLMQLPWDSIDYVLLHELTHTKVLHHGPIFWTAMEKNMPDVKLRRKTMLMRQPVLDSPLNTGM